MPGFEGRSVRTQLPDRSAPGAGDRRLLLIEGIPGSGKTTAARRIAEQLAARGIPARWHLEESRSHPVAPRDLRRTAREPGFGPRLLDSWRRFAASAPEGEVTILEGTLFQWNASPIGGLTMRPAWLLSKPSPTPRPMYGMKSKSLLDTNTPGVHR